MDCTAIAPELILVVEDDAALLKLIEKCLAAGGHRTRGRGQRRRGPGLARARFAPTDALGLQPARHARRATPRTDRSPGKRVPFVVATGHGSESVAVEMMKRGAYDYLVKGATFMKLLPAGDRSRLGAGAAGRAAGRGRGATAAGPRRIGAARRAAHGGIGRGQPPPARRDGRTPPRGGAGRSSIWPNWPTSPGLAPWAKWWRNWPTN